MDNLGFREFYKRNLPHYQPEYGTFAITFRLAFSLPKKIKETLKAEKEGFERNILKLKGKELQVYKNEFEKNYFEAFDDFLDKYLQSPMWLSKDSVAEKVEESLHFLDENMYSLFAFCIMPNHVHLIIKPLKKDNNDFYSLANIMYSLKSFTANSCNKLLERKGQFWHHESYDHFIRDETDFNNQLNYLMNNPVKAKLIDKMENWKHKWINSELVIRDSDLVKKTQHRNVELRNARFRSRKKDSTSEC